MWSLKVCINFFEFISCWGYLLVFDDFCILVLNAKVAQLLNGVIKVGTNASDLVKQRDYGTKKSIAGKTRL